ncbi:unnamed protein product [Prunus armeniaca]|uniref:Uncharacterized protein n=1 Tax=Prunus armeniaca TaxID=36596 RepID=A0A6J5UN47_PRUAR|nr:unnamed protein product [Prunus armeniaca]
MTTLPRLMKTRSLSSNISLEEGIRLPRENQSTAGSGCIILTHLWRKNSFFVVGCDTKAYLFGGREDQSTQLAASPYVERKLVATPLTRTSLALAWGVAKRRSPWAEQLTLWVESYNNHIYVWDFNPCGFASLLGRSRGELASQNHDTFACKEIPPAITGLWVYICRYINECDTTPVRMDSAQIYKEITLVPVIVATATKTRLRASKFPHKHA